jgi:hypothetical protein
VVSEDHFKQGDNTQKTGAKATRQIHHNRS